jgi:hypothetical protein
MFYSPVSAKSDRSSLSLSLIFWLALAIGIAERVGWALARKKPWTVGEAPDVAIALAHGRGFSDAFWVGQGPTAHVLPIAPAIAGAVYALLGVRSFPAEMTLLGWSLACTFAAYALVALAFARIGVPRRACFWAFVWMCVAPIYTTNEAFEWRIWEGALGLTCAGAALLLMLRAEDGKRPRGFALWLALLPAFTFFVNPVMGMAAFAAWALFVWRHRTDDGLMRPALGALLALALFVVPWTIRNERALGHPIPLRDNLGMEIAVGNHQAAVHPADIDRTFLDRLKAIQPFEHPVPQHAMVAAGGEVAYSKLLGHDATTWMRAHPGDVAILWARHFREMLFTRKWQFKTSHGQQLPLIRASLMAITAILALIGMGLALRRRSARYLYAAAYVWVPTLLYVPFQPVLRYTWLIYPALVCFAADTVARTYRHLRTRQSSSSS